MQFRRDINGLRAIAVMAVVLFHFNPTWITGGFAGVDTFFVISGFLMTGIIFRGIEKGDFSILKFYVARANRIVPALTVLCLLLVIFGWFYLTPLDYKTLGKHVASSIGFLSNIIYWSESGYFDAVSKEKWLLHTWSLSVEWQFYILYPLVLATLRKYITINAIKFAIVFGTILGFIFSVVATYYWPDSSYYLLTTRAWEMLLGGVAYLYPFKIKDRNKRALEWFSIVVLIGSYFLISKDDPWPGYLAIFPVLGSFLLIQAQNGNSIITGNIVSQKLGTWSYSIYLWHWPLVVAIYYFSLSSTWIYLGITMSIFLGFISFKYVENIKFKKDFASPWHHLKCKPIYFILTVGVLGTCTYITKGFESHYPKSVVIAEMEYLNKNPQMNECHDNSKKFSECSYGEGDLGAIIIGDSHAASIVHSVEKSLDKGSVLDWTKTGCPTMKGAYKKKTKEKPDFSCAEFIDYILQNIKDYPNIPIIILNRYAGLIYGKNEPISDGEDTTLNIFFKGHKKITTRGKPYTKQALSLMKETVCQLSKNSPVFMLKPIPELKQNVPKIMAQQILFKKPNTRIQITKSEYLERNKEVLELLEEIKQECGVKLIEPDKYFCDDSYCYGDINGRPVYFDDDHLSEFGASFLIPEFKSLKSLQ